MPSIQLPPRLESLASGSGRYGALQTWADAVRTILVDNKLEFFPAYTDHGLAHVERVLADAERLMTAQARDSTLLSSTDAVVLIAGTLLHDIALHIQGPGFEELVSAESRFRPLSWFSDDHPGRPADVDWFSLWREFRKEVRQMGSGDLARILGPKAGPPGCCSEGPLERAAWTLNDRLVVGEFVRRHHCRIAHEVAIYGFPGLDPTEFPPLAQVVPELADAIGAVARSHGEPLLTAVNYTRYLDPGNKRPCGALLPYLMALLRVADFAQLQADRAPRLLLKLKEPSSPATIREWNKHAAVPSLSWDHQDPRALHVITSSDHGYRTHLALGDLLDAFQAELDRAVALLDYEYGGGELAELQLAKHRVTTNLHTSAVLEALPYYPVRTSLRSDRDLFRLVVQDLYGDEPEVAGRELLQNALDAVGARSDGSKDDGDAAQVVVEVEQTSATECVLRVEDRGVGMLPETVADFFLTAGASLRPKAPDSDEALLKAGRFGIGAFAAFLLSDRVRVTTRHVSAERGVCFEARLDSDLVELCWTERDEIGTRIEVPFDLARLIGTPEEFLSDIARYHKLPEPRVEFRFTDTHGKTTLHRISDTARLESPAWAKVDAAGVAGLAWRLPRVRTRGVKESEYGVTAFGSVVHNGILVHDPPYWRDSRGTDRSSYEWEDGYFSRILGRPALVVKDPHHVLPITLSRYGFSHRSLPFEHTLLESIGWDVAACAAGRNAMHPLIDRGHWYEPYTPVFCSEGAFPPFRALIREYLKADTLLVEWHFPGSHPWAGPADPPVAPAGLAAAVGLPAFMAVSPAEIHLEFEDATEIQREGYPLVDLALEARLWGDVLGLEEVATVAVRRKKVRPTGANRDAPYPHQMFAGQSEVQWRSVGTARVSEGPGVFLLGRERLPDLEQKLVDGLCEHPQARHSLVAASAYRASSDATLAEADKALARGWLEGIGKPLNRQSLEDRPTPATAPFGARVSWWRELASEGHSFRDERAFLGS